MQGWLLVTPKHLRTGSGSLNLQIYEVSNDYIEYLCKHQPHMFHNAKPSQLHNRKYIGVVLEVNGFHYLAPLSSFKPKHEKMDKMVDMVIIGTYAVLNLNNMFPVPEDEYHRVFFSQFYKDPKYQNLLRAEYRIISDKQEKIRKQAQTVYELKLKDGNKTGLARRCNDFKKLEALCKAY